MDLGWNVGTILNSTCFAMKSSLEMVISNYKPTESATPNRKWAVIPDPDRESSNIHVENDKKYVMFHKTYKPYRFPLSWN